MKKKLILLIIISIGLISTTLYLKFFRDESQVKKVVEDNIEALNSKDHIAYINTMTAVVQENTNLKGAATLFVSEGKGKFKIKDISLKKIDEENWLVITRQELSGNKNMKEEVNIQYHVKTENDQWKISMYNFKQS